MDIGSVFLILALMVLVAAFITRPLTQRGPALERRQPQTTSELLAERERILEALLELDFDHEMGKIPEDLYPSQRTLWAQRGAEVLRRLDAANGSGVLTTASPENDEIEAMIAARRKRSISATVCSNCGTPAQAGDRFCARCGAKLD